jgi:glycine cleavage system transcriptional repressor
MIILTSGNSDNIEQLIGDLDILREKTGLDVYVRKTKAPLHREALPSILYKLIAVCIDRPGIVHQICKVLHDRKINIEDISTNVDHDPTTGANVFQECADPRQRRLQRRYPVRCGDQQMTTS